MSSATESIFVPNLTPTPTAVTSQWRTHDEVFAAHEDVFAAPPEETEGFEYGESHTYPQTMLTESPPEQVEAGRQVINRHPMLANHSGTPPDLVMLWNAMPVSTTAVDVVVHLHGYSPNGPRMRLSEKLPISGLNFIDPTTGALGRQQPTIGLLPRGNYFGGRYGNGYNFPELVKPGAIQRLTDDGLALLRQQTGISAQAGRLILTGHSGGGAPVNAILRHTDPAEVYIFDGTYGDASSVIAWAQKRIVRGRSTALRVLYRPGSQTQAQALRIAREVCQAVNASPNADQLRAAFRVEATTAAHEDIPRLFGWRLLTDSTADLPRVIRKGCPGPQPAISREVGYDREGFEPETGDHEYGYETVDQELEAYPEPTAHEATPLQVSDFEVVDPAAEGFEELEQGMSEATDPAMEDVEAFEGEAWDAEGLYPADEAFDQIESPAFEDPSFHAFGFGESNAEELNNHEDQDEGFAGENPLGWNPAGEAFETLDADVRSELEGLDFESLTATPDRQAGRIKRGKFAQCTGRAQLGALALARQWNRLTGRKAEIYNCRTTAFGTPSLHGEGRAIDCYASVNIPAQAQQAERYIRWLIDNAVELQVAVVIWNRFIWSWPYRTKGWRAYRGDPHTDHLHVELSWEGARHPSSLFAGAVPGMDAGARPTPSQLPQPSQPAATELSPAAFNGECAGCGHDQLAGEAPPQSARRTLGSCRPVQDDQKPEAPWNEMQMRFRKRCSIFSGRTDPRSAVDCACAFNEPRDVALFAMARVIAAGPLAARLFAHFLGGTGTEVTIDVADMIARSKGVRAKIRRSIARGGNTGTTRIEQSDYGDTDLQFAYGAIDCVQWRVLSPSSKDWRKHPQTRLEISMLDYYEFHRHRPGVSQCAHAACVELVARGSAKNFWTSGTAIITLGRLTGK